MKKVRWNLLCWVFSAILVIITSCSRNEKPVELPLGNLKLNVGISVETEEVLNQFKAANPSDFRVTIYTQSGEIAIDYEHAYDIPEIIALEEGSYYVVANSANNLPAAFNNDYYSGQSDIFQISGGETTSLSLTCSLANIMVTVHYEQNVIDDFDTCITTISNSGGALYFGLSETRAGYFDQGPLQISTQLGYLDGQGIRQWMELSGNINQAEAGRHYEIHIDASLNQGSAGINLNVDESFETELVSIHEGIGWGDIIITEIMFNPLALGDSEGEWIEVYNNSGETLNLHGLCLRRGSNNDYHTISADVILMPEEFAVLGRTNTAFSSVKYVYNTISLPNSGENIIINTFGTNGIDGDVICSVDYGAEGFNTSVNGSSLQLNNSAMDASSALIGSNWCPSSQAYNTGDFGTPGLANDVCQ